MIPIIGEVSILLQRGSDHAPVLLHLDVGQDSSQRLKLWRLSGYWISDEGIEPQMISAILDYWSQNPGTAS